MFIHRRLILDLFFFTSCGKLCPLLAPFRCGKLSRCTFFENNSGMKKPLIESLPGTDFSSLSLSRHDGGGAEQLEGVPPRHGAPLAGHGVGLGVAALAHDLHVWGVAAEERIQRTLAVAAGEASLET